MTSTKFKCYNCPEHFTSIEVYKTHLKCTHSTDSFLEIDKTEIPMSISGIRCPDCWNHEYDNTFCHWCIEHQQHAGLKSFSESSMHGKA